MRGKKNSVMTRLRERQPLLLDIHCICHAENLVMQKSSKFIPSKIEQMLREIYDYLSYSPKRTGNFKKV